MVQTIHTASVSFFREVFSAPEIKPYLERLRQHHAESYSHSMRVGLLSLDLGLDERLDDNYLLLLGKAGLLHDVGKLNIPVTILSKRGSLDGQERTIMDEHPAHGFALLATLRDPRVRRIAVAHHEYKPSPYPRKNIERRCGVREATDRRTKDPMITSLAQIVAVADLYDALASKRSYKPALPKPQIEKILREQFGGDPKYITMVLCR